MSDIKVLHVIARMNVGGTARYVGDLVKNIPGSVLATGFVQNSEIEDVLAGELPLFRLNHLGRQISPFNDLRAWLELRTLVRELKPEIIHTHTFKAGLIGRLIIGDHKRIHTFHGHLFGDRSFGVIEKGIITLTERLLARRTDLLISVGEKVGKELRAAGIGKNRNWTSIPPGVTPLSLIDKKIARNKLGLSPDQILIGWMARMTGVKNPHLFLKLAKHLPQTNFVMAGGGELLEQIRALAPSNVQVLGWTDASLFWSSVDIAVSTSDNEGMPISIIEAQLAGIPVVTTNVGSVSEVVSAGITGIITSKNSVDIANELKKVLLNKDLLIAMGAAAASNAAYNFSTERMILAHSKNYKKLVLNFGSNETK